MWKVCILDVWEWSSHIHEMEKEVIMFHLQEVEKEIMIIHLQEVEKEVMYGENRLLWR